MTNEQIIYNTVISQGYSGNSAKILISQAKVETGNFTSNVFKTDNNAFGMKMPSVRKTTASRKSTIVMKSEGSTPYAHYESLADSVKDVLLWLKNFKINIDAIPNVEVYAATIKNKGYFGAALSDYQKGMKKYFGMLKDFIKENPKTSLTAFFLPLLYSFI